MQYSEGRRIGGAAPRNGYLYFQSYPPKKSNLGLPPWWSTSWWFRAACVTLLLLLIWFAYRYRMNQMARRCAILQRSEDRLRRVIDTIPTMAWSALADGSIDFVSQSWLDYTGSATENQLGTGWRTVIHPEDLDRIAIGSDIA
jgi:PAS domain-containing protein